MRVGMAAAVAGMLAAGGASAAVVTFSGAIPPYSSSYVEDGVTVTTDFPDSVSGHLDDSGTEFARFLDFTMATRFSAESFDLYPTGGTSGPSFCPTEVGEDGLPGDCINPPYENVKLTGYLDGSIVATDAFSMYDIADEDSGGTYAFGEDFAELDSLVIGFSPFPSVPEGFELSCGAPCTHFTVDNVTLTPINAPSPIPLPATAGLLIAGLAGLGLMRRSGRRS